MPDNDYCQIGVFFDGTGNNMENDIPAQCETNVVKLYELYQTQASRDLKVYKLGVGSTTGTTAIGGFSGAGALKRIEEAYAEAQGFLNQPNIKSIKNKYIDVVGFSRGAASARHFVNMIKHMPFTESDNPNNKLQNIKVRFLGLFDTVGSFGLPGNDYDEGFDFHIDHEFVQNTIHFTAMHERRALFDLQSMLPAAGTSAPDNMLERPYIGAHSEVGGGYEYRAYRPAGWYKTRNVDDKLVPIPADDKRYDEAEFMTDAADEAVEFNESDDYFLKEQPEKRHTLSRIALRDMYKEMKRLKIDLYDMEQHPRYASSIAISDELESFYQQHKNGMAFEEAINSKFIHDSRYITDKAGAKFLGDSGAREIYYPQPQPVVWKNYQEMISGEWEAYDEENA